MRCASMKWEWVMQKWEWVMQWSRQGRSDEYDQYDPNRK
jgi:hypothetical protein